MPADERDLRQVGLLMRAPFRSSRGDGCDTGHAQAVVNCFR